LSQAIERSARDYHEGWFEGDPDRLARCLHPKLVKRNVDQPDRDDFPIDENDWDSMVNGAREGRGTKHRGTPDESQSSTRPRSWRLFAWKAGHASICFTSADLETPGAS
jgi:hypothetical protein